MTLLVGTSDTTGLTNSSSFNHGGGGYVFTRKWTASESGTANKLYIHLNDASGTTARVKIVLYNSSGTLLGSTSAIQPVGTTSGASSWINGSISDTTITSGQDYYIGVVGYSTDGRQYCWYASADTIYRDTGGTPGTYPAEGSYYTTPPASATFTTDTGLLFAAYADGTVSGSAIINKLAGPFGGPFHKLV